jgi:hypothetical protein
VTAIRVRVVHLTKRRVESWLIRGNSAFIYGVSPPNIWQGRKQRPDFCDIRLLWRAYCAARVVYSARTLRFSNLTSLRTREQSPMSLAPQTRCYFSRRTDTVISSSMYGCQILTQNATVFCFLFGLCDTCAECMTFSLTIGPSTLLRPRYVKRSICPLPTEGGSTSLHKRCRIHGMTVGRPVRGQAESRHV